MKRLLIFLLMLQQWAAAQSLPPAPPEILLPRQSAVAYLAETLTQTAKSDKEKVEALFYWIASNIQYRLKPSHSEKINWQQKDDTSRYLPPLDLRIAEEVLAKRVAVCEGYARLFKTLCLYADVPCEMITGFAKNGSDRTNSRFQSNHNWNAVYFDSSWHLLDVTWASGYILNNNQFVPRLDDRYFLTEPKTFLEDHYPEDLRWTLLENPPLPQEFFHTPFKPQSFIKKQVTSYRPKQGVLNAAAGDTIVLEITLKDPTKKVFLIDDRYQETALQQGPLFEPEHNANQGRFIYRASDAGVKWLSFLVEGEVVLKYRIDIKKPAKELLLSPARIN